MLRAAPQQPSRYVTGVRESEGRKMLRARREAWNTLRNFLAIGAVRYYPELLRAS